MVSAAAAQDRPLPPSFGPSPPPQPGLSTSTPSLPTFFSPPVPRGPTASIQSYSSSVEGVGGNMSSGAVDQPDSLQTSRQRQNSQGQQSA